MKNIIYEILESRPKATPWKGERFKAAEVKRDGIRLFICKDGQGHVTAHGRKRYIDYWPELSRNQDIYDAAQYLPHNTILDGELFVDSHTMSSDVIHFLKEAPDALQYEAFAVPFWRDRSQVHLNYGKMRELVTNEWPWPVHQVFQSGAKKPAMMQWIKDSGAEGLVLKGFGYSVWWKLKPEYTIDAVITGFQPGQGRHTGKVGSLSCSVYGPHGDLIEIANVSGMTDLVRNNISSEDLGRVIEIQHDGIDKERLRFPRFLRFRPDKPPEECSIGQLQ